MTVELVESPSSSGAGATLYVRPSEGAVGPLLRASNVELVRIRELRPWDVNFWLPAQRTLRADELPPTYTTSTHLHNIGAFLTMAKSMPSIPALLRHMHCHLCEYAIR